MSILGKPGWETAIATFMGLVAGYSLPPSFYGPAVSEVVTILGVLMAALIPAMMLGATALRAGGFSVKRLKEVSAAIDAQISIFGGLFVYGLATSALLVVGSLVEWHLPTVQTGYDAIPNLELGRAFPAVLTALFVFLALRSAEVIKGVRSILRLSSSIAVAEAQERDAPKNKAALDELAGYEMPKGYASRLDHPN